jgi:formamidopyrimidine-DNA glycosylase
MGRQLGGTKKTLAGEIDKLPELPEVETIRSELEKLIPGKVFSCPVIHFPGTIENPAPEDFIVALEGKKVEKVTRRGKYLFINLDQGILVVHLRMTGNLIYSSDGCFTGERFLRLSLPFKDGSALHYADMRRFGRLWYVSSEKELEEIVLKNVGPDIYNELDCEEFEKLLTKREKRGLKALLLDQAFAAGMGNIYTDECLFRCGFNPNRQVYTLSKDERKNLYRSIRAVLEDGIAYGGTSFRDYRNAAGALGDFQNKLAVYNRAGEKCTRCGAEIIKTVVAGRGTYYCPCCQPEPGQERKK